VFSKKYLFKFSRILVAAFVGGMIYPVAGVVTTAVVPPVNAAGTSISFPWAYSSSSAAGTLSSGWVEASTGMREMDDGSVEVLANAFTVNYFGTNYSTLYVSSNLYVSFTDPTSTIGAGTSFPSILIGNRDSRSMRIYYKRTSTELWIRWEGYAFYNSGYVSGTPNTIYEMKLYSNQSYIDIGVGIHGSPTSPSGVIAGNQYKDYWTSSSSDNIQNTGRRFSISSVNTVTFDSNTATSGAPSITSVTQASVGASVTLATQNTLARTGFTFSGWNSAADGSGTTLAAGSTYTPASSLTLYAQWNSTISYDTNTATSGTAPPPTTAKSSAAVTTLATNSGTLAKTGYTFGGWNRAADGSSNSYASGATNYPSDGNRTLYAQWNSVVTYLANGSTGGTVPTATTMYGLSGTLASNSGSLVKVNSANSYSYTLTGWNRNETGTGTSYALGTSYTPAGNVSLYAEWSSVITYNGNNSGGTGSAPSNTTIKGTGGTLATNSGNLTLSGKVFAGWNTSAAGTGTWYAAGSTYPNTGNVTLYAQWVNAISFTGSSNLNFNQGLSNRSDTYTATGGLDTKTVTYVLSSANAGITLETATVTGTTYAYIRTSPTVLSGTYIDTLTATDRAGASVSLVVTINIAAPLQWAAGTPSTVRTTFGSDKSIRIDVTGGYSGKSFTITQGSNFSSGITLDTSTASSAYVTLKVSKQVAQGTYSITLTATDVSRRTITTAITITVGAPIRFTSDSKVLNNGYSNVKFDGLSQYLNLPASSKYQLGSTWTVEWWQYETDTATYPTILSIGTGWAIRFGSAGTKLQILNTDLATLTPANYKNKWTHFAIVNNGGFSYIYVDGVAMNSTALSTVPNLTSTAAPATTTVCIAVSCTNAAGTSFLASSYFGGMLTNLLISKRAVYSGTSTSSANFAPSPRFTVDSQTILALTGIQGSSTLLDVSPYTDTSTAYNSPIGSYEYPTMSGVLPVVLETTESRGRSFTPIWAVNDADNMSFSVTSNTSGLSMTTADYYSIMGSYATLSLSSAVTATDSVTARTIYETLTATDAKSASASIPLTVKINPRIQLAATTLSLSTPAQVTAYDTVTASFGTGTRTWNVSAAGSSGITFSYPTNNQLVIKVGSTTTSGTYYETVTVTDAAGDSQTAVITINVTPGLSISAADSATSLTTTFGLAKSLRIASTYGSGIKTYTLTHRGTVNANITLDISTASSEYVTLNIGSLVTAGTYTERIQVMDAAGSTAFVDISVTVNAKPTISYNGATSGAITLTTTAGTALTSSAFTAALGTGSRTLSLSGLNSGITIDTSTTNIAYVTAGSTLTSTNSTTARTYNETITVTDSLIATSVRAFSVVVNPAIVLSATSVNLTTTAGISILDTVTATQGTGTKTFTITSSPSIAGITNTTNIANQTTLTIPNTVGAGTYTIAVTATDSVGATSSINITLNVNGSAVLSGSNSISMTTGYGFTSGAYIATNGTGSFTFSLSGTLNSSYISIETTTSTSARLKILSGAPSNGTQAATYYETITATDSIGGRATLIVTLTVNPVIALSGTQSLNTTFGVSTTNVYQITGGTAPYYVLGKSICAPVQTIDGSYTVLSFVAVGICTWKAPSGVSAIDYLVVGGGGGGDRGVCSKIWGHGGGGGEVVKSSNFAVTAGSSYSVTVGKGGNGTGACLGTVGTDKGGDGDPSIFNTTTARGGKAAINTTGEGGVSGNGNVGGNPANAYPATGYVGAGYPAGGGGGAGGAGTGLDGGIGVSDSISGASIMYGSGGAGKNDTGFGTAYSGGAANASPTPNRGGGGSDLSPFSASSAGATGVVIVRYLTPTVVSSSQLNIYTDTYLASPGKIVIGVPDSITVGSYVETFTVTDSAATPAVTTYVVTINIAKATPIVSVALPDGGSIATYGSPAGLTSTSSTAGAFTFKKGGTDISGCVSRSTSGGSATCNWTPTDTSTVTISAAFTPTDTTNYNSVTSSNFTLNVNQADTLTVTFGSQNLTFSESGTAVSRAFTLSGLASIDTVTAVSTAITGTANDGTAVNVTGSATNGSPGTSSVSKAGTFSLSGTTVTFSGSTRASYYKAISYAPGTITINKAGNSMTVNYGVSNTITYKQTGTETATVSYKGTGSKSFSTTSTSYCSMDTSSGALTTLQSGSCDVDFYVAESANYLGDTITATVRINKATRSVVISSGATTLKYGDTTTVTNTVSLESATATISVSSGSSTGCSLDLATSILTATSGTGTCSLTLTAAEDNKYLAATSSPLAITLGKADAPVLTLTAPANVDYSPTATSATMPSPTFTITGLKLTDTLTAVSGITISYVATGTYPYSSATVPTSANTYALTPTAITLSSGSMGNYNSPTFTSVNWTINKINQETLTVKSLFQEGISVPYDIQYVGGSTAGAVTGEIIAGGSATGCSFSGINLRASSTGTCRIRLKMAANQNYFDIYSDTYTVLIARFVQNTFNFDAPPAGTVIVINSAVPVTKGPDACTSNCQPKVTSVSPTTVFLGDPLTITGVNFTDATEVIFDLDWSVTSFQIDNGGTTITVIVPSDLDVGPGVLNVRSPQGLSPLFQGFTVR
jgi:uncharacterized repeat protein (TIGR02543 family)